MCNLSDAFMEEQYQDPEFLAWLEQKNKNITEQMEQHHNSLQHAYDVIAGEMNEILTQMEIEDMEKHYDHMSQWELLNEL
jgi:hypothetical protein